MVSALLQCEIKKNFVLYDTAVLTLQDKEAWTILESINKDHKSHEHAALKHKSAN